MYMQGQENMYSGLRTRTAVLEHVRRSFARSGVHWPTNPRVIVTLTLLMRQHLMACFEKQALSPFPQVAGKKLSISVMKHLFIPVHYICKMPESYGSRMVQCDSCDVWFLYFYYRRTRTLCLYFMYDDSLTMFFHITCFLPYINKKLCLFYIPILL